MDEKDALIAALKAKVKYLEAANKLLRERLSILEHRLGLDSHNSSNPPSSDGLSRKPTPQSLRTLGQRATGGQKGHQGNTLEQIDTPDAKIIHEVVEFQSFHQSITQASTVIKRQVFDIPSPKILVTEHQTEIKVCSCGHQTVAAFPQDITAPVQYRPRVKALAVYLLNQQFIPEDCLQQTFQDVFGLNIATTTLYDYIIKEGLLFHERKTALAGRKKRPGHNLLIRLRDFKETVLRFLTTPEVPFTNNQAEQDMRMMKVKQKISGGFRTQKGAEMFCTICGFLSTKCKQGINLFQAIEQMYATA